MKPLVWLDLCSGLGGASQPALNRGWTVIRVDIDPRFKPDIVADVRALPLKPFHVDVLWASPPCQEFSKFEMRCFFPNPPEPDLSIAHAVRGLIDQFSPRWWAIENVRASRPWLSKIFGQVRICSSGHAIWSNLGFLVPPLKPHKAGVAGAKAQSTWVSLTKDERDRRHGSGQRSFTIGRGNKDDIAEAAKIPYEIGEAICLAVERRAEERQEA